MNTCAAACCSPSSCASSPYGGAAVQYTTRARYSDFSRPISERAVARSIDPSSACEATRRISIRYIGGGRMSAVTSLATYTRPACSESEFLVLSAVTVRVAATASAVASMPINRTLNERTSTPWDWARKCARASPGIGRPRELLRELRHASASSSAAGRRIFDISRAMISPPSYSRYIGTAMMVCETASGGVSRAAMTKMPIST